MRKRIRYISLCLTFLLTLGLLAGCGKDAVGIRKTELNNKGELVITYTDGSEANLGVVVGSDGKDGADGKDAESEDTLTLQQAAAKALRSAVSIECSFPNKWSSLRHQSGGAGVIYRLDKEKGNAVILTNFHVVYSQETRLKDGISDEIKVYLYGSELLDMELEAEYVGGSLNHDVAVLYVEDCEALKETDAEAVSVASSLAVFPGQTAFAVGNPTSEGTSVTAGIISVDSEYVELDIEKDDVYQTYRAIRTDAAVNPGNSGGGLFNERGELIGLIHAKTDEEGIENMGFAIPAVIAVGAAENILDHCFEKDSRTIAQFDLGLTIEAKTAKAVYDPETGTVDIREVVQVGRCLLSSPFSKLLKYDIVKSVALNGQVHEVTRHYQLDDLLLYARVGDTVEVTVERNGEEISVSVELTEDHLM